MTLRLPIGCAPKSSIPLNDEPLLRVELMYKAASCPEPSMIAGELGV
jgi:hypothetical protein